VTPVEILASPFAVMILALAVGYLLYAWSRRIAPRFTPYGDRTMPYVGGEACEAQAYRPGYDFFYVALFFTVVHVAVLIIAVTPPGASLAVTLGYLLIIALAVTVLRWEQ
jgi:NADH:ubiquinone oxidoreductase subunit 3 (subunit A)